MIELNFTGRCYECPHADLKLKKYDELRYGGREVAEYEVICSHEAVCKEWESGIPKYVNSVTFGEEEFMSSNPKFDKALAAGWNFCVDEFWKHGR